MPSFRIESRLAASTPEVWSEVTTAAGINKELGPWLHMTVPREFAGLDTTQPIPLGRRLFRSWILLFGVLPIDYDDLTVVRLDPGRGFLERSSMATARIWQHERLLEPDGVGCRLVDELRWEPRSRLFALVLSAIVPRLFRHRHRRLRARFGSAPSSPT